jgi:phenylpyruvate tautomerase PptA (4-oxalocrotonate tautomerase family)
MPYLAITTNVPLAAECESALAAEISKILAEHLKKPQGFVMVSVQPVRMLRFAGSEEPSAFLDLKSIGLPNDLSDVSLALTQTVGRHAGIPASRDFLAYADISSSRWAHEADKLS